MVSSSKTQTMGKREREREKKEDELRLASKEIPPGPWLINKIIPPTTERA
jgi:hypothetical protein